MFVGHIALALASKRAQPKVSLGWFVAAVGMADMLWPVFLLTGLEQVRIAPGATAFTPLVFTSYPWSHSLVMLTLWGLALAWVARARGVPVGAASILVLPVMSHWLLDYITHAPDMPLWPGASPHLGLGLWDSIPGTLIVEGLMWVGAIAWYVRDRRASSVTGTVAFWSFVVITTAMWASGPWAAPPRTPRALAWLALVGWIMVPWAAWADRRLR